MLTITGNRRKNLQERIQLLNICQLKYCHNMYLQIFRRQLEVQIWSLEERGSIDVNWGLVSIKMTSQTEMELTTQEEFMKVTRSEVLEIES